MTKFIIVCYSALTAVGLAAPPQFTEALISGDFHYPYGIAVGDLDGDGDLDITVADAIEPNSVYWFENDGTGKFTRHLIHTQPPPAWRLERHVIADVNHDGRPDIVIVENSTGDLRWLENPGPPHIRELWAPHFITWSSRVLGAYDVDVGDIDGDGLPDVAASSWRMGNMFTWHKNPGPLPEKSVGFVLNAAGDTRWVGWKQYTIADNLLETRMVRLVDLNQDGQLDVLGTATRSGLVLWFENPGKPTTLPWTRHFIDKTARPSHGQVVDLDGDGDVDVVMASGHASDEAPSEVLPVVGQVVWYENLGKGETWKKHIIQTPFPYGFEAVAKDLDGDGDIDVVATAWHKGPGVALAWFENNGGDSWIMHPLKSNWHNAVQVIVADLDGDGRPDILASAEYGSRELRWWRTTAPDR